MKATTKNQKRNDRFSKRSFFNTSFNKVSCNFFFFQKQPFFIKFVVSLTTVIDDPSLTIDDIIVNKIFFFKNNRLKKQLYKKRSQTVFIVFKNDRHKFSKSSKRVGRFKK